MEYQNRRQIEGFAQKYELAIPERHKTSRIGELQGRRSGSSIEYQDRRDYVPGDDPRYIDWRAFARTDRLTIKLYREEISPVTDIIVDTSLSMSVTSEKAMRRTDLGYLFYLLSLKLHALTHVYNLGKRLMQVSTPLALKPDDDIRQISPVPLLRESEIPRRPGIKIIISDFLFPFSPEELIGMFHESDRLILLQVLSAFEDDPEKGGPLRLQDAEDDEYLDVLLNKPTIEGYKSRLNRLRNDLERLVTLNQGAYCCIIEDDAPEIMMDNLLKSGVVTV